jgi:Na+-driven multidrug efflux pump
LGGDLTEEAWRLQKFFNRITFILVFIFSVALWFTRPWILEIFKPLADNTAQLLLQTLAIFCGLVWLKVINMIRIIGVLRAGGDNKFCLITDSLVMWGVGLPIYAMAVFVGGWPFTILYALMFLEDGLKFLPVYFRIQKKKWMKNLTLSH